MFLVTILENLASSLARNVRRNLLELARLALALDLDGVGRDLVLEQPTGVLPPAQDKLRIGLLRVDNGLFDVLVDRGFHRAHESGAHVDALGTKAQRSSQALSVRETSRGNERNSHGLAGTGQQDEVGDVALANVAGAFEAVDGEEVDAELHGAQRVPDCGALVQNDTRGVGFLQLLDDGTWAVAGGLHNANALFQHYASVCGVVWGHHSRQKGEVDSEGVGSHCLAAADLFAKVFRCRLGQGCDETKTTSVGHGGCKLSVAHPHHAALDDGDWRVLVKTLCGRGRCYGTLDPQFASESRVERHSCMLYCMVYLERASDTGVWKEIQLRLECVKKRLLCYKARE